MVSRPRVRQPSRRTAGDAGAGLPPVKGPRGQDNRVHPRREGHRPGQAVVLIPVPRRRSCATPCVRRVVQPVRGPVRPGLRTVPRGRPGEPEAARHRPARHRIVAGEPVLGCQGAQRRTVAVAGHGAAVGIVERRGEAAVLPDGGGIRRVPVLHRRPDRARAGLSRGIRTARQHPHRGDLRQRRIRRGWSERICQRGEVLQRLHRHRRGEHAVLRPAGPAADLQPLPDRVGDGVQHALQALQALRVSRGWHRGHRNHLLAQWNRRARRDP